MERARRCAPAPVGMAKTTLQPAGRAKIPVATSGSAQVAKTTQQTPKVGSRSSRHVHGILKRLSGDSATFPKQAAGIYYPPDKFIEA